MSTDAPSGGEEVNETRDCREVDARSAGDATMSTYRLVIDVYLVGLLCVAGWVGNALSVAVLRRDLRRSKQQGTTNWLLQTLAMVDSAFMVTCILIQPLKTIYDQTDWGPSLFRRVYPYVEPHAWALASIAQTTTVWLVLLVTVDRYFAVCLPMKNEWRSLRRAKLAVLALFIAACVYNIPRFLERVVVFKPSCVDGEPRPGQNWTWLRTHRIYFLVYKTVCYFIFRSVGPLVALIALNSRLAVELRNVDRRRTALRGKTAAIEAATWKTGKPGDGNGKHHENLTAMLVGVVTVFIICQLPGLGIRVAYTAMEFGWTTSLDLTTLRYANVASNTLLVINSAVNIVVYCLVGKRFRRILVDEMFGCSGGRCRCTSAPAAVSRETAAITAVTTAGCT